MSEGQVYARGGRWATDELADLLAELTETLRQVEAGCVVMEEDGERIHHRTPPLYEVFRLVAASRSDGFRRRSGVGEGGPSSVLDDEGFPMPPRSDPTGELAVADLRSTDPIRKHAQAALRALVDARSLLRVAKSETILAFEETDAQVGEPGCRPHAQAGRFELAEHGERCRWCYDFWRAEGVDPTKELIVARSMGKRITSKMVSDALAGRRPGRKARRGKVG